MNTASSPHASLVSVVMPAYKADYLHQALESVRAQSYRPLELVVCDDSRDETIQTLVEAFAATVDFPVHYHRNRQRLWETRSTARAIGLASGEFIKFLHDDDVLHADCIGALVAAFAAAPDVTLAAARRRIIDADGKPLPEEPNTAYPFCGDVRVHGRDLTAFLVDHTRNFIGEPSAVLCRRAPLLEWGDRIAMLDGVRVTWVADLAIYVKLLRHGQLAMLQRPLIDFRISPQQFSQAGRDQPGIGEQGHEHFRRGVRAHGWYEHPGATRQVRVAPLQAEAPFVPIDLVQALDEAHARNLTQQHLRQWQHSRVLSAPQRNAAHLLVQPRPRIGILLRSANAAPEALQATLSSLPLADTTAFLHCAVQEAAEDNAQVWNAAVDAFGEVDWIVAIAAGSVFQPGGLDRLALTLATLPVDCRACYADAWQRDRTGGIAPLLRPDFDLELLLAHPAMMAGQWLFRRTALMQAGRFSTHAGEALELALILHLVRHGGGTDFAHLPEPLLETDADSQPLLPAHVATIAAHLHHTGQPGASVAATENGLCHVHHGLPRHPLVSIVVVVQDSLPMLQRCLIALLEKTSYPSYEILLVNNASTEQQTTQWLEAVADLAADRIRVFAIDQPCTHTAACNLAATQAQGEFLLFLRHDTAVVKNDWLEALLEHALRPEAGIVGAKTVSAEGRITHAGLVPGLTEAGGRVFFGEPMQAPGYLGRLQVAQRYAAVSDSCLLLRRTLFEQLDGFDAAGFPDGGADIDLCLRAGALGNPTHWTPHALLLHNLTATPLPAQARQALLERWLPALAHDPAYHPSLRLDVLGGFKLGESEFSWQPLPTRTLPRVLAHPADTAGSGQLRVIQPFRALQCAGLIEGAYHAQLQDVVELERIAPDSIVFQRRIGEAALAHIEQTRRFSGALRIYELDDYLPNLPLKSVHRAGMPRDIVRTLRRVLSLMDRVVVSTPALAEAFADFHPQIRVVENRLDPIQWRDLPTVTPIPGAKPRVGWAGGISHTGDLELIADVVRELAGEVTWVFFGLCPEKLRPYVSEFHPGVDNALYPHALARLGLDLALAPLEQNFFNACKSNLRLLEYGACGYPVIASQVRPYQEGALPVTLVRHKFRDWTNAIRQHLADPVANAAAGAALRAAVHRDWMLEGAHLHAWQSAWLAD